MDRCRWKMATALGWRNVCNAVFVVLSAYFFTAGDGQDFCMGGASNQLFDSCVTPVMRSLRWSWDSRPIEEILTTTEFWQGYCNGVYGLRSCFDGRLDHNLCNEADRYRFVQMARYDIAFRLATTERLKSIYPIPDKVCDGYDIKDEVLDLYSRTAGGFFTQCIKGEKVQACLLEWYPESRKHYLRDDRGAKVRKMSRRELRRLTQKTTTAYECVQAETQICDAGSQDLALFIFSQTIPHAVKNNVILAQGKPGPFQNGGDISPNTTTEHELNSILVPWEYWMFVQFFHEMFFNRR